MRNSYTVRSRCALTILVGALLTSSSLAGNAEPVPMELAPALGVSKECTPCRIETNPSESAESGFFVKFQSTRDPNVSLASGDYGFDLHVDASLIQGQELFPLYRVEFSNSTFRNIYAMPARREENNLIHYYIHYYGGVLSYLGALPRLFFDKEAEAFVTVNPDGSSPGETYFSLRHTGYGMDFVEATSPTERASWCPKEPYAGDWKVTFLSNDEFSGLLLTRRLETGLRYEIPTLGPGEFRVLEEQNYKNYDLVIYSGGTAGTSTAIEAKYAAIYVPHRNKIVGAYPIQYRDLTFNQRMAQPDWVLEDTQISISDPQSAIYEVISIPIEEQTASGLGVSRNEMKIALLSAPIELEFLERPQHQGEELMIAIADDYSLTMQFVGTPNDLRRVSVLFDVSQNRGELNAASSAVALAVLETTLNEWEGSKEWFLDAINSGREDTFYSVGDITARVLNQSSFGLVTLAVEKGGTPPQLLYDLKLDEEGE